MPGKCSFNIQWLFKDKFQLWLLKDPDQRCAKCRLCSKSFDISNTGEAALVSHMRGRKHTATAASISNSIREFVDVGDNVTAVTPTPTQTTIAVAAISTARQTNLDASDVTTTKVLKAEVLWALKVMNSHYSYKLSEDAACLFQATFPNSQFAGRFACGEKKCSYVCTYGLAPYFKKLIVKEVSQQPAYVMLFDESPNKHLQSKQMDLHVRLRDGPEVKFIGHPLAANIVEKLSKTLSETGLLNLMKLSIDGPNVNWKVFN